MTPQPYHEHFKEYCLLNVMMMKSSALIALDKKLQKCAAVEQVRTYMVCLIEAMTTKCGKSAYALAECTGRKSCMHLLQHILYCNTCNTIARVNFVSRSCTEPNLNG